MRAHPVVLIAPALCAFALTAAAPLALLKGNVYFSNERAAAGASLLLMREDGKQGWGRIAGARGFFVFNDLPAGEYRLLARAGDKLAVRELHLSPPFAAVETLHLQATAARPAGPGKGGALRVSCIAGNLSVSRAQVYLLAQDESLNRGAVTGDDGVALLTAPAAPVRIAVEALGFRLFETPPMKIADGLALEIELAPDSALFPYEPRSHYPRPAPGSVPASVPTSVPASVPTSAASAAAPTTTLTPRP